MSEGQGDPSASSKSSVEAADLGVSWLPVEVTNPRRASVFGVFGLLVLVGSILGLLVAPRPARPLVGCVGLLALGLLVFIWKRGPALLREYRRSRAIGAAPALVSYAILQLQLNPTMESAADFASEAVEGRLGTSLKTHRRGCATGCDAFESCAADWADLDPSLERAVSQMAVAVDTPPLFASARDDPEVQAELTDALADAITFTAGNTLAFFPNYAEARRYHDRVADTVEATCYLDHPGEDATGLRERFVADDNGALFTSLWGTLTEGVSFDGTDARSVVVVGVPYPRLDDRTEAIQAAYDRVFEDRGINDPGWHYAVEVPTVRKTRQALGRVIRSPEDIGTRILLDRRYTAAGRSDLGAYSVYETLPEDLRAELVDVAPEKLKFALLNFYQSHDAYDGTPPAP